MGGTLLAFLEAPMRFLHAAWSCASLAMGIAIALPGRPVLGTEPTETAEPVVYNSLTVRPDEKVEFDLAKWQARARVVYLSSGAIAFTVRMIDDDLRTVFRFSGSDLQPTAILELARGEPVHHVGAVFNAGSNAKLDVYLLNALPNRPGDLSAATPLACTIDQTDAARAAITFAPTPARYVAFRWTRLKSTKSPFNVAEVSVFSAVSANELPPIFAEAALHFPGESGPDFSNKLGTLADPPTISVVSP